MGNVDIDDRCDVANHKYALMRVLDSADSSLTSREVAESLPRWKTETNRLMLTKLKAMGWVDYERRGATPYWHITEMGEADRLVWSTDKPAKYVNRVRVGRR